MPIITTLDTRSPCSRSIAASTVTCSAISPAARLRPRPMLPVAQKVHASGQPDCDETQTVRRLRWLIATASTGKPSRLVKRSLMVPSADRCDSTVSSWRSGSASARRRRRAAGSGVSCS